MSCEDRSGNSAAWVERGHHHIWLRAELICSYLTPLLRLKSWSLSEKYCKPQSNVEAVIWLFQSAWITEAAFYLSEYFGIELISSSLTAALLQELHPTPAPLHLSWLQPQSVNQPGLEHASTAYTAPEPLLM